MQMKQMLHTLCLARGVTGCEAHAEARRMLEPLGPVEETPLGSLLCTVHPPREGAPHILLDAHLDEIGLIVTGITDDGFVRVSSCGGVDRRLLPASSVTIHAETPIPAVVCFIPPHLQQGDAHKAIDPDAILLDTGLDAQHVREQVRPGDRVSFDASFTELMGGRVSCKSLDNRSGCAAVLRAGELLHERHPSCGVSVMLSTLEEVGGQGARTAAYALNPTHAIVVDVSFAKCEGAPRSVSATLGSGAMIGVAPILNRRMSDELRACAARRSIRHTIEVMSGRTGTNADDIAVARAGVQTALLSIPMLNMHTPVEIIDPEDVEAVAQLIAAYVCDTFGEEGVR